MTGKRARTALLRLVTAEQAAQVLAQARAAGYAQLAAADNGQAIMVRVTCDRSAGTYDVEAS